MTTYRNDSKGPRGILLKDRTFAMIDPGETKTVPDHKIKAVPPGLTEIDTDAEPSDLPEQPEGLEAAVESADAMDADTANDINAVEIGEVEYPANLVIVTVGQDGAHTVNAPWLDEPEVFADAPTAESRQLELRELGPPEGWVDPLDRDEDGAPGGSKKADPPALSGMTMAQLTEQAGKEGVDVAAIKGTGMLGRVKADDIRNAIEAKREADAAA